MLIPAFIVTWTVIIFPLIYSFYIGLTDYYLPEPNDSSFIGLQNFGELFQDARFWGVAKNTFLLYTVALQVEFILGFFLALLFDREIRAGNFLRALITIPLMLPPSVVGLQFRWLFNDQFGFFSHLWMRLGFSEQPVAWLASTKTALWTIVATEVWQFTPFVTLILLAGMRALPVEVYEAATVDGASYWQQVRYITLPMLRPIFLIAIFIRTIDVVRIFDVILLMTRGGPGYSTEIFGTMIYRIALREAEFGYGAALSSLSVLVIFITVVVPLFRQLWRSMRFKEAAVH